MAACVRFIAVMVLMLLSSSLVLAQNFLEVRGGFTEEGLTYRHIDYGYEFENGVVLNATVFNSPESTELWLGGGKSFKIKSSHHYVGGYLVVGSDQQVGLGLTYDGESKYKRLNLNYTVDAFVPAKGKVHKYLSVDSLDATVSIKESVEVGASFGAHFSGNHQNLIGGPMVRINDKLGSTSFSLRGGAYTEFRLTRSFHF